ncbi:hypothetical protein [Novosphingobium sp. KN65.2]|uniref:hypothetical protein n=1 Tax=Novosphingobium sp. KN65.2 TaxID=1478134 RepID=UPI0005E5FA00|nr:hypothetical protein [Novosphingobium sp. KN65.2]CDO36345.1 conserved exported hypothetical protein [Novosphingobium sp. KN65.2]
MRWLFGIFLVLYILALLALTVGTFGWFGQEKDPLSGAFLMPLGLPWNLLADRAGLGSLAAAVLAPGVNLGILGLLVEMFPPAERARDERREG